MDFNASTQRSLSFMCFASSYFIIMKYVLQSAVENVNLLKCIRGAKLS